MSNPINLEAVDIVGAAHRRLAEVASHLMSAHPAQVDCDGIRRNLVAVDDLIAALADMQKGAAAKSSNGAEQHAPQ
jgi:hypothetical protein